MSIRSQINRIKQNIENSYSIISSKGGSLPEEQNSANIATAISTIPVGSLSGNIEISFTTEYIPAEEE